MARPSAIRSGQNATSMDLPKPLHQPLDHSGDAWEDRASKNKDLSIH